jgi:hypothetical protein
LDSTAPHRVLCDQDQMSPKLKCSRNGPQSGGDKGLVTAMTSDAKSHPAVDVV